MAKKRVVFDIEADALLDDVTKIHCLSYKIEDEEIVTIFTRDEYIRFFRKNYIFIGHNVGLYDFKVLIKLLGINFPKDFIDTLMFSYYLFPKAKVHGLEFWGKYFKFPKLEIEDWKNLTQEQYQARCERDVIINHLLFLKIWDLLNNLYDGKTDKIINYLKFKTICFSIQQDNPIKLDIPFIEKNLKYLKKLRLEKKENLESVLPLVPIYGDKTLKNVIEVSPGEYIDKEDKRYETLKETHPVIEKIVTKYIRGYDKPNANSHVQVKNFLFSLGWKPLWNKMSILKSGEKSYSPQIGAESGDSGELCSSVIDLIEKCPEIASLESLGVLQHRIGVLKGFLRDQKDGYIVSDIGGLTNTLRIKHRGVANLVGKPKPYWEMIRGSFICEEDEVLIGADLSGLESSTQHHYMYPYDPEYVLRIRQPGYDPHLTTGILAGLITEEEGTLYKSEDENRKEEIDKIGVKRYTSKQANFSITYGAYPPKIAQTIKKPLPVAKKLFDIYWELNHSIIQAKESFIIKRVNNQDWVFNPISELWVPLKKVKDVFNTVNQSSGAYVFDVWLKHLISLGAIVKLQYHDEFLWAIKKEYLGKALKIIEISIKKLNKELNLNVEISYSAKTGSRYSECH